MARNVDTINTMDCGWIYNECAAAYDCTSLNSADNGFSLSRGNLSVIASNLYVKNCAGYGVWLGGFLVNRNASDYGPTNFNVTNISVMNAAWGGLYLDEAPSNGRISGIYVNGVSRGTVSGDFGDSSAGTGIRIGGSPSNDLANQVALATNIRVTDAVLLNCAKGGVIVSGCQDVTLDGALIVNPGSANDYSGNPVASSSTQENFGITYKAGSTSKITRFAFHNVSVVETRTTPLANYPAYVQGATDTTYSNLRGINTRVSIGSISSDKTAYSQLEGTYHFNNQVAAVAGILAGANTGTGSIPGFAINGAKSSERQLGTIQSAGLKRWSIVGTSDAESGANVGTRLKISAYADDGSTGSTVFEATRDGQIGFNGVTPVGRQVLATGASHSVDDVIVALQKLGLVRQS